MKDVIIEYFIFFGVIDNKVFSLLIISGLRWKEMNLFFSILGLVIVN